MPRAWGDSSVLLLCSASQPFTRSLQPAPLGDRDQLASGRIDTGMYVSNTRQHICCVSCSSLSKKKSNTDLRLYARAVRLPLTCPNLHFRFKLLAAPQLVAPSRSRRVFSRASGGAAPPARSHPALPVPLHSHRGDKGGKGVARRRGRAGFPFAPVSSFDPRLRGQRRAEAAAAAR